MKAAGLDAQSQMCVCVCVYVSQMLSTNLILASVIPS